MVLDARKVDPIVESKLRSFIMAKFGRRKKGELSRIIEVSLFYYLENPQEVEDFRKKKKEELKKLLKANLY